MRFDKEWYRTLNRSSLTPPNWTFGVVWPILYGMIIVSGFTYFTSERVTTLGIILYLTQWILNLSWSPLFFGQKQLCISLGVIIGLVSTVLLTMYEFQKSSAISAYLLVPYLLWISFASYLNAYICLNN